MRVDGPLRLVSFKVWEYERGGETLRAAKLIEAGGLEPPRFEVEMLSRLGEHVTVVIRSGTLTDPRSILYVEKHGTFEIVSVEPWPESGRFLTLRPWPGRA